MTKPITTIAAALAVFAASASAQPWPAPIQAVADRGIEIVKEFDAPGELTGYAAHAGHRSVALYLMPDGEHVVVGTMLDAQGNELTSKVLDRIDRETMASDGPIWPRLEDSHWVADGSEDADRVVYVFTDPNCPYCHKFWKQARPWVESGSVQLRHIMVGILKPTSPGKAAAILGASDSGAALKRNEHAFDNGGIDPMSSISDATRTQLEANRDLMRSLNLYGTPGIVYRDEQGDIQTLQGMPRQQQVQAVLGER